MNSQSYRIAISVIAVQIMLLFLASCTVKEDRRICPCILDVFFSDREIIADPVTLVGWSDQEEFGVRVKTADYPERYTHKAPRTMISFGAAEGVVNCQKNGHFLIVPEGYECDSLYVYSDLVDCTGETACTTVIFHKQFATVHLGITNKDYEAGDFSFVVESHSCGIDMLTCAPVEGDFRCMPRLYEDKKYRYRIPRQSDESMKLAVTHYSGDTAIFPLGRLIDSIGYDWEAKDLQDIYITLDITRGRIGVGVAGWEGTENFELSTVEL